jgi:hypothetical protein
MKSEDKMTTNLKDYKRGPKYIQFRDENGEIFKKIEKDGKIFHKWKNMYYVSKEGIVYNLDSDKYKKPTIYNGYATISIAGVMTSIHRLVAETLIPNPNNLRQVNHIDGNKLNNDISNLEWVSQRQNIMHAIENGLIDYSYIKKDKSGKFLGKKVKCIELNREFESFVDAAEYIVKIKNLQSKISTISSGINKAIKSNTKCHGYTWIRL